MGSHNFRRQPPVLYPDGYELHVFVCTRCDFYWHALQRILPVRGAEPVPEAPDPEHAMYGCWSQQRTWQPHCPARRDW